MPAGVRVEVRRHYAHHRIGLAVQSEDAAEYSGIAGEVFVPDTLAEDDGVSASIGGGPVLLGTESPAQRWLHSEDREQASGGDYAAQAHGLSGTGQHRVPTGDGSHIREGAVPSPPVDEVGVGNRRIS